MAKQKKENYAQKSVEDLKVLVKELRSQLVTLRMDHAKNQLKQTRTLTNVRKQIARALTAMREKTSMQKEVVANG